MQQHQQQHMPTQATQHYLGHQAAVQVHAHWQLVAVLFSL